MSREIKYRGKVEGDWWAVTPESDAWQQFWVLVDRETVGQCSNLIDRNGQKIWEDDIIEVPYIPPFGGGYDYDTKEKWRYRHLIVFEHGSFCLKRPHHNQPIMEWCRKEKGEYIGNYGNKTIIHDSVECKVIGNIYNNPELLEQ